MQSRLCDAKLRRFFIGEKRVENIYFKFMAAQVIYHHRAYHAGAQYADARAEIAGVEPLAVVVMPVCAAFYLAAEEALIGKQNFRGCHLGYRHGVCRPCGKYIDFTSDKRTRKLLNRTRGIENSLQPRQIPPYFLLGERGHSPC